MQRLPKSLLKLKRKKLGYWRKSVVSAIVSTPSTLHKCSKDECCFETFVWKWWLLTQSIRNQSIPMRYLRGYKGTWLFYMRCTYCCHHCRHCRYEQRDMMSSSAVAVVNLGERRILSAWWPQSIVAHVLIIRISVLYFEKMWDENCLEKLWSKSKKIEVE